jgi:GWxTD domain-containing protein
MIRFIISLLLGIVVFTQNIDAQNVKAYLNYNVFYSPKDGQYIETYVAIEGRSLHWVATENNEFKSQVELTVIFRLDSQIVTFTKDIINSPKVTDSTGMRRMFMHTNRFQLKKGNYDVSFKLDDINDTIDAFFTNTKLDLQIEKDSIFISSIEIFNDYKKTDKTGVNIKGGYLLSPNIYNFIPESDSTLNFYAEIYNTEKVLGKDSDYLLSYYIVNNESNIILPKYKRFKRLKAKNVQIVLNRLDISDLPTGNFSFIIEIRNREAKLEAKNQYFFQRQNSKITMKVEDIAAVNVTSTFAELITGSDTLSNIIRSFAPISSGKEKAFAEQIIKKETDYVMQQYIYSFWEKRNQSDPFKGFKDYMAKVRKADIAYGSRVNRGYETERGRVYLQYGEPNSIVKEYNDPAAYPYEIWHYYQARNQRNIKFVFYNTDLTTNEFNLLHSTAIGEPNNYQWRLLLRKRDKGFYSIDEKGNAVDDWGSNYNRYFESPR